MKSYTAIEKSEMKFAIEDINIMVGSMFVSLIQVNDLKEFDRVIYHKGEGDKCW